MSTFRTRQCEAGVLEAEKHGYHQCDNAIACSPEFDILAG
jgi:hypothetical protein